MTKLETVIAQKKQAIIDKQLEEERLYQQRIATLDAKVRAMQFWSDLGTRCPDYTISNIDKNDIVYKVEFPVNNETMELTLTIGANSYYTSVRLYMGRGYRNDSLDSILTADSDLISIIASYLMWN